MNELQHVAAIEWLTPSVLVYCRQDKAGRPVQVSRLTCSAELGDVQLLAPAAQVWRHALGEAQDCDELLLTARSPTAFLQLQATRDAAYVLLSSSTKTTSEARLGRPQAESGLV